MGCQVLHERVCPSVCLSVCIGLYVCMSAGLCCCCSNSAAVWSSCNDNAIRYALPVLSMTSCFQIMGSTNHTRTEKITSNKYRTYTREGKATGSRLLSPIAFSYICCCYQKMPCDRYLNYYSA